MTEYRLYFLKDSVLLGEQSIDAADDNAAAELARRCGRGNVVEVWSGHARVRIVAPAGRARLKDVTED